MAGDLSDWFDRGIEEHTLPSGMVVKLRRSPGFTVAQLGSLPNEVLLAIDRLDQERKNRSGVTEDEPERTFDPERAKDHVTRLIARICSSIVEPVITIDDFPRLPPADQNYLTDWLDAPAEEVAAVVPFRERGDGAETGEDVAEGREAAE